MAAAGKAGSPPYAHPVHGESSLGRGSFLGARLPAEVEAMARGVRGLSQETFRRLLTAWPTFGVGTAHLATVQTAPEMCIDIDPERPAEKIVVSALEGKDCKESVRVIAESVDLSEEQLTSLISGMYTLLREALRLPVSTFKQEVFKEDLQELRIPEEFIMDFASVVFGNRRPVVEATTMKQGNKLPSVNDIKWRVDVAISTSSLARALQPSILMLLKLSDGTAHRFEVPVVKFQELRYNVALILKEMNDLEKRSILKIQD